ncbi:MAG: LPP20 family lipoprotein [Bacteroidales bacterium]|nr:LPP20 family lipoprotein [Bacteroidales bacterium]
MKKITLLAFCIAFAANLFSQSIDQIKADRQTYIWGEGSGTTLNRADQEALQQIVTQISAQVESKFTILKDEVTKAGKSNFSEEARLMMSTYSNATLTNTERIVLGNEPDAKVFRYIKRSDLSKVFEQRKRKIIDFTSTAENAAQNGQIADALKYYYWALALLRSHPDGSSIEFVDSKGQQKLLLSYLPARINDLFASLRFTVSDIKEDQGLRTIVIGVNACNRPAANLDYSFWDGKDWSAPVSVKDGVGFMEFYGDNASQRTETQIRVEYIFEGEARIDRELEDVMKRLEPIPFRNATFNLKLVNTQSIEVKKIDSVNEKSPVSERISVDFKLDSVPNPKFFEGKVDQIIASLKTRSFEGVKSLFTAEGFDIFNKLLGYGQAKPLSNEGYRTIKFGESVICRGPKMSFAFSNNTRKFVEDVVFHFDSKGKISSLAFGLGNDALSSIVSKTVWSEAQRLTIIDFLENYKTAYALKRLDYIKSIFADDALIIIGNSVKIKPDPENPFLNNSIIKYNRYSKQQYIKNLEHCFGSNEYINLTFEESDIRRAGQDGGRFGIQIKQNYYSTNYGDQGYLFLLVDLKNPNEPMIYVRTWQPEKNPDGSIYGVDKF